ncbi:MAG: guanylate kinase [Candidatus Auribacterota bacterium]|nr:guanylate kinase [Candidatus Auribacterota bacterium]
MSGHLFILSAPSGAGKTTVCDALLEELPELRRAITTTTRPPRTGEVNGVDYFFLSREEFQDKLKDGRFLEHAVIYDNYYGSGRDYIETELDSGRDVILVVDVQGAQSIQESGVEAVYIFLLPPSLEILRARLVDRKTDSPGVIAKRMAEAREEISRYKKYDYCVINDDLSVAVGDVKAILRTEKSRVEYFSRIVEEMIS